METELIHWLRDRTPVHSAVPLGIGDDGAVVDFPDGGRAVVTTDMLMDGVDFLLEEIDPQRAGHKALAVNLSDLAAMAARPVAAVVSLALPRQGGRKLAKTLYEGMAPLAQRFDVALAGGDTNSWDGPLVVSVTLLGTVGPRGPLTRGGARSGDRILVTGRFGGSILGRHLDVRPRVDEALELMESSTLHAGIDVSDGLARDLDHIAVESHCGALLDLDHIPIHADAERLAADLNDGSTPLGHGLGDGEDFELILAVPPDAATQLLTTQPLAVPLADIGVFTPIPGLWARTSTGDPRQLPATGYEHAMS